MSPGDAPLYVHAHDLDVWLVARVGGWGESGQRLIGAALVDAAHAVLGGVSVGLTFPRARVDALRAADHALLNLRVLARVAHDAGLFDRTQRRFVIDAADAMGRMLGGWRRRVDRPPDDFEEVAPGPCA